MSIAQTIASLLLDAKAVKLSPEKPFKWSSGWNSPIYCDNRVTLSFPETRTFIKNALVEAIKTHFPAAEAIAGVATAGIPQGALVADVLGLPFFYVRPKPKDHGMGNQIEGKLTNGQHIVLVEDLISTGGSSLKAADAILQAGGQVLGMAAIFTYGFEVAAENFRQKNIELVCLSNYEVLLAEALQRGYIQSEAVEKLTEWRQNPAEWSLD